MKYPLVFVSVCGLEPRCPCDASAVCPVLVRELESYSRRGPTDDSGPRAGAGGAATDGRLAPAPWATPGPTAREALARYLADHFPRAAAELARDVPELLELRRVFG